MCCFFLYAETAEFFAKRKQNKNTMWEKRKEYDKTSNEGSGIYADF